MKNAMQLKALIKNMAREKNIAAQLVLQNLHVGTIFGKGLFICLC